MPKLSVISLNSRKRSFQRRATLQHPRPLSEWQDTLRQMVEGFFIADDEREPELHHCVASSIP